MIEPFKDAHLDALDLSPEHRAIAIKVLPTLRALAAEQHVGTIVARNGTIIGVYGAGITDASKPDEVEVFLFVDQTAAQRHAGTLVKDLRHELNRARAKYKAVRATGANEPLFFRWFGHLGFLPVGAAPATARGGLAWA